MAKKSMIARDQKRFRGSDLKGQQSWTPSLQAPTIYTKIDRPQAIVGSPMHQRPGRWYSARENALLVCSHP